MKKMNRVFLIGNLGADPELKRTDKDIAVTNFTVATTEFSTAADGERKEFTEWHRVVCWRKTAETCASHLRKGSKVSVEGKLKTRSWTDKDGAKRYATEVHADHVLFLSSPEPRDSDKYEETREKKTIKSNPFADVPW